MITDKYGSLNEKSFWNSAITNTGSEVVLCGRNVRLFDCNQEQFSHLLSRLANATVAISHDQEHFCVLSTSTNTTITLVEYARTSTSFSELKRSTLKGLNTDGGKPCFSTDDKHIFFCVEAKQVWRFSCADGMCSCIYQVEHPDQRLSLDVYEAQLLIILNSHAAANHNGIDILTSDGSCIKSLRHHNEQVKNKIIRGKWLNARDVLLVYPLDFRVPHDAHQIVAWRSATHLNGNFLQWPIAREGKGLYDVLVSPQRNYIAYVWLDMLNGGRYTIGIYDLKTLSSVSEYTVDAYMDIAFSDNDKFLFVCSDVYMRICLSGAE